MSVKGVLDFPNVNKLKYLKQFFLVTSIHGLIYLGNKNKKSRYLWFGLNLLSLGLCTWQSAINVRDYARFHVSTKSIYQNESTILYPAFTIWNSNYLRKTVIGRRIEFQVLLAVLFKEDIKKIEKTCNYKNNQSHRDDLDEKIDNFLKNALSENDISKNLQKYVKIASDLLIVNREMIFLKCYWKRMDTDCAQLVANTFIHNMWTIPTFSVNLNRNTFETMFGNNGEASLGLDLNNTEYEANSNTETWRSSFGMKKGYEFILNVHEEEYCRVGPTDLFNVWKGVGLHVAFHDPELFPNYFDGERTIFLTPGFEYTITLKPQKYLRHTEHLKKCISTYPLYTFETKKYSQNFCLLQCEFEFWWNSCKCIAFNVPNLVERFVKHHNIRTDDTVFCLEAYGHIKECYDNTYFFNYNLPLFDKCSQCKPPPCYETVYRFEVTAVQFPSTHLGRYYQQKLNMTSAQSLRKNLVKLNVFIGSSSVDVVEDKQQYSGIDLFVYIGNNIGLFLGMSFISFHEISHFLCLAIFTMIWKQKKLNVPSVNCISRKRILHCCKFWKRSVSKKENSAEHNRCSAKASNDPSLT